MFVLILETPIDLDLSMYPSFASALFHRVRRNEWMKVFGYGKRVKIRVINNRLECEGDVCNNVINEWAGLWFNPLNHINEVSRKVHDKILTLMLCFNDLRLIISSHDKEAILIATFLSRRTDYHRNVIRWIHRLLTLNEDPSRLSEKEILSISRSYQLRQLSVTLHSLIQTLRKYGQGNPWKLRYELLRVKYVGPKVVDSFLLFTGYGTYFTASDVHYINFMKLLKIFDITNKRLLIPSKNLCLRFGAKCLNCPYASKCITGLSINLFGKLSGYVQTIAYVIDKALRITYHYDIKSKVYHCLRKSKIISTLGLIK